MNKKRLIVGILEILIGVSLTVCNALGMIDPFWSGMGTALVVVGTLAIIRSIRYKTNKEYKEKFDTETKDERNRFLSMKAWSWTGYLLVLIFGFGTIIMKLLGYEDLMMFSSSVVCLISIIYWISYVVLKKKY